MAVKHNETVQREFTRQAEAFRAAPILRTAQLTERVAEALGPKVAREADTASPVHLVRALAEQLPLAPGVFDGAVLRLALHHFVEPATVLAALRPLLRRRGRLVVLDLPGPQDPALSESRNAFVLPVVRLSGSLFHQFRGAEARSWLGRSVFRTWP